ncbi:MULTISPECIES: hypothetical protein [Flavobacteriaceae]|uniref:hypothetical protein n=1 Tax=Flavobacteriaceae TaxID=49546 RepID=UPI00055DD2AC|nr:hypothetical protein [Muricauda sp. MAR_2010_75]
MAEVVYDTLNFEGSIDEKTFRGTLKELGAKGSNISKIELSGEQLNSLIAVLFVYGLHYDELAEAKRPRFLNTLVEEKLPLFQLSQLFSRHLLNNLGQGAMHELQQLQQSENNIEDVLSNESLLDFVEMEMLDPTTSFRKWEYGRFAMAFMGQNFFGHIKWDKIKSKTDSLKSIGVLLEENGHKLDSQEKRFLQLMAKGMLLPQKVNMSEFLHVGSYVQENMMGLSVRIKELSMVLESIIEKEIAKQKGKEGPSL